jgi:hypothetical protein
MISTDFGIGDWRFVPRLIRRMFDWSDERFRSGVACVVKSVSDGGNDDVCLGSDEFVPYNPVEWIDGRIIPPERQLPAAPPNRAEIVKSEGRGGGK